MTLPPRIRSIATSIFIYVIGFNAVQAEPAPAPLKVEIDLSKSFGASLPWRFTATQEPAVFEPVDPDLIGSIPEGYKGGYLPGLIHLCLQSSPAAACDPLVAIPQPPAPIPADAWAPHYLKRAEVVYARAGNETPLFLLQAASSHSPDGNQAVFTQLLAYNRAKERFEQVYAHATGHNNNEEDRFIVSGPLQGSVISAEPTANAPFGYWITVNKPGSDFTYKQVLRYRSATRYGDGNPLAVIDSEMPNIERRLDLWHPGMPLPLPEPPEHACPNPRLVHEALWCT
jgi:hypothetical protein